MTSKRKRKYSQDFSGVGRTDRSFGPACDVNQIVQHYQQTGLDPHQNRIAQARYETASTMSFEDAMRNKAEMDSYNQENPNYLQEQADLLTASEAPEPPQITTEAQASTPAEPAAQHASGGDSE